METKTIYSYTREQAVEDGVLVDISDTLEAREAGFQAPVALTRGVFELVKVPEGLEGLQDYEGRLWDTCFMATLAFRRQRHDEEKTIFPFYVLYQMEPRKPAREHRLWLVFNEYEGFTIMRPEEY